MMARNIGVLAKEPEKACENDRKCPFHGELRLHGRTFAGTVVRTSLGRNALVEWTWPRYSRKYERYEKRRTRVMAHNPSCIAAQKGDHVKLMESRKLSKTKSFVIIEKGV
jgi:small subunit ribosomal protein S17